MLVHPQELDFSDQDVAATLERINPSLSNARGRDVANLQHNAVAEALSRELGNEAAADAAKLLALSSPAVDRIPFRACHLKKSQRTSARLIAMSRAPMSPSLPGSKKGAGTCIGGPTAGGTTVTSRT